MRFLQTTLVAVGLLFVSALAHADDAANPFARDIKVLADWFAGEFDNEEQRWFEADPRAAVAEDDRVIRIHTLHKRLALPAFGEHVFYVEEYVNNDPAQIMRQRLVTFRADLEAGAIRMQQGFFKDTDALKGGYHNPDLLADLRPDDVFFLDDCDVYWHRKASQFEGAMKPKACQFGDGDERRYSLHNLTLAENYYWRVDSTFLVADDSLFAGYAADRPIEMRRAYPFTCSVFFYGEETVRIDDLALHSQGGLLSVERASDGAVFEVLMRDKQYPYYETRPDFMYFSIRPQGERRSIAFSVNDPSSRQLGVRTPEIGAFCHRDGYEFLEALDTLP
ncbi:MAG: chromophore lyase CpcT/CpeT [Pseudomonadota bacterium]